MQDAVTRGPMANGPTGGNSGPTGAVTQGAVPPHPWHCCCWCCGDGLSHPVA